MSHTYTIGNTTANTGNITLTSSGTSISGYGAIPSLSASQVYTTNTGAVSGGVIGSSGQIYTTTGTNGASWHNPADTVMKINQSPPELEVKGRMVINGIDLEERLKTIEKVLQIPERDVKLEKKHPKLKKLYDEYINALGKYRTFDAIKGDE
jgi:hypothetical protein